MQELEDNLPKGEVAQLIHATASKQPDCHRILISASFALLGFEN